MGQNEQNPPTSKSKDQFCRICCLQPASSWMFHCVFTVQLFYYCTALFIAFILKEGTGVIIIQITCAMQCGYIVFFFFTYVKKTYDLYLVLYLITDF